MSEGDISDIVVVFLHFLVEVFRFYLTKVNSKLRRYHNEIKRRARSIFLQRIPKTIAVTKIQLAPKANIGNALSIPIQILRNEIIQILPFTYVFNRHRLK